MKIFEFYILRTDLKILQTFKFPYKSHYYEKFSYIMGDYSCLFSCRLQQDHGFPAEYESTLDAKPNGQNILSITPIFIQDSTEPLTEETESLNLGAIGSRVARKGAEAARRQRIDRS